MSAFATVRLIPARAGNTSRPNTRRGSVPAHPRSRGEHCRWFRFGRRVVGSSPLARGTPVSDKELAAQIRLIPARAGNTKIGHASTPPSPAHPRSRGEHEVQRHLCTVPLGSSPLARGTRLKTEYQPALARLIPARAGNTSALQRCVLRRSAHPRSRGEHASGKLSQITSGGSSPLARGTHFSKIPSGWSWRLIPARAGNTG